MRNMLVFLGGIAVVLVVGVGLYQWLGDPTISVPQSQPQATTAPAPAASVAEAARVRADDFVIGTPGAPVTVIEYASLTCPHCAAFHRDTLPKIKKDYIDTGKVRLVYRDFPLGTPALAASMIARCAGRDKFFGFIEIIYRSQDQWSRSRQPLAELTRIARFGGMSETDVEECLKLQELLNGIRRTAAAAQETHKVNSTPTFIIGKETISGAMPYENFKKVFDRALSK